MPGTECATGILKRALVLWALLFAPVAFASPLTRAGAPVIRTDIRVRLNQYTNSVVVSGQALSFTGGGGSLGGYRAVRLSWQAVRPGLSAWHAEDRDTGAVLAQIDAGSFHINGSGLRINLRPIQGVLTFLAPPNYAAVKRGEVALIAAVDLETYVRGVLPAEMPATWPLSALKAQAVAARTYALFRKRERERQNAPFDVDTDVSDQMFQLPGFEEGADSALAHVEQAIRDTKGVVLASVAAGQPQLIAAYYHADCGGHTEDARAVWGKTAQSLGTTVDEGCPLNPAARWNVSLSGREIAQRILGGRSGTLALADFETVGATASGRVDQVRLTWSDGKTSLLPAADFRMAVGHDRLKSTNFKFQGASGGQFAFAGQGFGHGVGLCQWGARAMASNGQGYEKILKHYYPQARLATLR